MELIAHGENSLVEFKRDDIRPEQLAKEIVAFANTYDGRIILCAEDNGDIFGIRTKVIPIMRSFNGTEPEFEASEDFLKTTLYNNGLKSEAYDPYEPKNTPDDPNLDPNEPKNDPNPSLKAQILSVLQKNLQVTYQDMAQFSEESMVSVKCALTTLKMHGIIRRQGSTRSGSWQILKGASLEQSNKSSM